MEWPREKRYQRLENFPKEKYDKLKEKVKNSPYRQKFHIQPNTGLLNDPNGFSYFNGKYHLFYQWFPLDPVHGVKYWYHLSSTDLVTFTDEGIAMKPDTIYDSHGVFSGTALPLKDKLFLFYTGNTRDENWIRNPYQCIATMDKEGQITKNDKPFINKVPDGYTDNFRDPKVFIKNGKYYCLVGAETDDNKGAIVYYSSNDLKEWEFLGNLKTDFSKNSGFMWECPDYFEFENKAVLMFSPQGMKAKGDKYNNIFQSGYLIGEKIDFEKGEFKHQEFKEFDRGFEFYAPQTMEDNKGRRILIGWFGLPGTDSVTDKYDWAHCLTIPRVLELKNNILYQKPLPELVKLRKSEEEFSFKLNNNSVNLKNEKRTYELDVNFENIKAEKVGIKFRVGNNEETIFFYDLKNNELVFDRTHSGELTENFEGGDIRKCKFKEKKLKLHLFLDESSAEIFVNDGLEVFSSRLYNRIENNEISFFTDGEIEIKGKLWEI